MRLFFSYFLIAGLSFVIGCKDGDQGPAGPRLSGTLTGFILLHDENGTRLPTSFGATVSLESTDFVATTDSTGRWSLNGVNTGIYNLVYAKAGFGTFMVPSFQFVGGGTYNDGPKELYELPSFTVASFTPETTTASGNIRLLLKGTLSKVNGSVTFFIGTSGDVSSDPAHNLFTLSVSSYPDADNFNHGLSAFELDRVGLTSGTMIYLKAYPSNKSYQRYYDPATGRPVYTGIGPVGSTAVSLRLP